MRAWGRTAGAACAVALLLICAQTAAAKPGYYVSKPSSLSMVHAKGSNGYTIDVFAMGAKRLILLASRIDVTNAPGFSSQYAMYIAPRPAGRAGELRASFGKLGRIAFRFRPSEPPEESQERGCNGRKSIRRKGQFVGTLRFRGERGFTTARVESARGEIWRSFREVCKRPEGEPGGITRLKGVSLEARAKDVEGEPTFRVEQVTSRRSFSPESVSYSATVTERHRRIEIIRSAYALAKATTFAVSDLDASPVVASVAPPQPFAGAATFQRLAGTPPSWSGDLRVEMPGIAPVALAGPSFSARLCRNLFCACPTGASCATFVSSSAARVSWLGQRLPLPALR